MPVAWRRGQQLGVRAAAWAAAACAKGCLQAPCRSSKCRRSHVDHLTEHGIAPLISLERSSFLTIDMDGSKETQQ